MEPQTLTRFLQAVEKIMPNDIFIDEICRRVHKNNFTPVLEEMILDVRYKAGNTLKQITDSLQMAYSSMDYELYYKMRYNLIYYDAVEHQTGFDYHFICNHVANNWTESDDDYFNVFEDLPMLLEEDWDEWD